MIQRRILPPGSSSEGALVERGIRTARPPVIARAIPAHPPRSQSLPLPEAEDRRDRTDRRRGGSTIPRRVARDIRMLERRLRWTLVRISGGSRDHGNRSGSRSVVGAAIPPSQNHIVDLSTTVIRYHAHLGTALRRPVPISFSFSLLIQTRTHTHTPFVHIVFPPPRLFSLRSVPPVCFPFPRYSQVSLTDFFFRLPFGRPSATFSPPRPRG